MDLDLPRVQSISLKEDDEGLIFSGGCKIWHC